MIRTLFWKEYREQRLFALLLVAIAGGLVALAPFAAPMLKIPAQDVIAVQQGVMILFAILSGVVSGALHWAAERENGTETFLDMMPVPRAALWRTKTAYAIGQWGLQMAVLGAVALFFGLFDSNDAWQMGFMILVLSAFWLTVSVATSAWAGTVLGSVGRAVPFAIVLPLAGGMIFELFTRILAFRFSPNFRSNPWITATLAVLWALTLLAIPLGISFRKLTAIDRARGSRVDHIASPGRRAFMTAWSLAMHDVRSLAWPVGVLLAATGLLAGQEPILAWLLFGSLLGAWLGVSVTDAEKHGGAFKLWADQRLPVGVLWSVKSLHRLVLLTFCCLAALLIVASFSFVQFQTSNRFANSSSSVRLAIAIGTVTPPWTLVLIGPLFGLGAGLVFPLITPRKVISLFGAGLAAQALTIFWMPMVGSGGLRLWQWLGVPLGLAATARVLLWPWVSGRLSTRATLAGLFVPVLGISGYWYGVEQARIAIMPKLEPLVDESAFMAPLRSTQAAQAGDRLNEVASEVLSLRDEAIFLPRPSGMMGSSDIAPAKLGKPVLNVFQTGLYHALSHGLKDAAPEVTEAFDHVLAGEWVAKIDALSADDVEYATLGPIELRNGSYDGYEKRHMIMFAGEMLLIDAIRREEAGNPEGALERIDQAFRISRLIGRRCPSMFMQIPRGLNRAALMTLDHWRDGRTSKGDLEALKQANAIIDRHLARQDSPEDQIKTDYLSHRTFESISRNLIRMLRLDDSARKITGVWTDLSVHLWTTAIGIEPEAQRRQRIDDQWFGGLIASARTDHQTLFRFSEANGNPLSRDFFFGRRYYNFAEWVTPMVSNPTPERNLADWNRFAATLRQDIAHANGAFPYHYGYLSRDIARNRAIFELRNLAATLRAHRILHGDWPKSLAEIDAPGFEPVPNNPMTGAPYVYEVTATGIVLKAPDPFPTAKNPKPRESFDMSGGGQRYALEFEIPSFVVK